MSEPTAANLVQEAIDQIIEAKKKIDAFGARLSPDDMHELGKIDDHLFNALKALGI